MKKAARYILALAFSAFSVSTFAVGSFDIPNVAITGGTISGLSAPIPVASGGTNSAAASGTALDNITGFSGTGFLVRNGAGSYSFTGTSGGVALTSLAAQAANTVVANATASSASPTAVAMPSCSTSSSALNWTTSTGFTCNASVNAATLGGTAAASYALLASPTFTGTPAAPTATAGTSTTQIATTAFVASSFAPLASPALTGTPTAPTAATNTSTTQLATAAFVEGEFANPPAAGFGSTTRRPVLATTISATSTITPSSTAGIVGTTTNDNANAGSVGEYFSPTGTGTALTSGSYVDLATQSLAAGDWDTQCTVNFNGSSLAASVVVVGVNTVANTQPGATAGATQFQTFSSGVLTGANMTSPVVRESLASTTTVRCGGGMTFSAGTVTATGTLTARRRR